MLLPIASIVLDSTQPVCITRPQSVSGNTGHRRSAAACRMLAHAWQGPSASATTAQPLQGAAPGELPGPDGAVMLGPSIRTGRMAAAHATPPRWGRGALLLTAAAVVTVMLLATPPAHGHGFLLQPQSRNVQSYFYDSSATKEYTPQGLSGGGGRVGEGGARPRSYPTRGVWAARLGRPHTRVCAEGLATGAFRSLPYPACPDK